MASANAERINATINELRRVGIKVLMPCHCTGKRPITTRFYEVFGSRCRRLTTGDIAEF